VLSKWEPVWVIMPIKDVYSLKGKLGDFSMQSKTPQVEGKTPKPKITDVYEKSGMTPEMASIARNLDESFGLDISKSDYVDEYVSAKLGKKFSYTSAMEWRYTPQIETAIKEARDIYSKFRAKKSSLPLSQKSEVKYSEPVDDSNAYFTKEAKKYKNFKSFVENIKELPVKILRNEDNFSTNLERWVFNKNRNRSNTVNYWEDSPFWTFDNFVKDIKENWIQTPIRVRINTDWKIVIADWTHRLLAAEELWLSSVPIEFVWKPTKSKLLLDIYNKANKKSALPLSQKSEVKYSKKDIADWKYNPKDIYKDYTENYMHSDKWKGKSKAIVIDSDSIKKMFNEYDPKNPWLVHEESSNLSKEFFDRAVAENPDAPVIFSAGWPASGKSEGIINGYHGEKNVIFDTVLGDFEAFLKKAKSKIKDWKVKVHAIYTDIDTAKKYNAGRDRSVPESLLESKHKWFRKAMDDLIKSKEYKEWKIAVEIRANKWGSTEQIPTNWIEDFIREHKNRLDIK